MLTLDEDDEETIDIERLVVEQEPSPPRFRINLRPVLVGLVILALGGSLGTAAYFFAFLDMGDLIGVLDVGDQRPKLAMEMPERGSGPVQVEAPAATQPSDTPSGTLLTPPVGVAAEASATAAPPPPPSAPAPPAMADAAPPPTPKPDLVNLPQQPPPPRDAAKAVPAYASLPPAGEAKPLPAVPMSMLFRETPEGPLPIIALDGRLPWREYRHPFTPPPNRPLLGVVVTGLGLDREATEAAIAKLPAEVTLAFSPYAAALDKWVKKARDAGHEVMLAMPTEPSGFPTRDPGPWGLLTSLSAEDNVARLEKMMVRMPGYVGVIAEDGPFVHSAAHLAPILAVLKERGLMFAGRGAAGDDLPPVAPVIEFADSDLFRESIDARLFHANIAAREHGRALVVVSATPVSLARLTDWMAKSREQGLVIAPASAVVEEGRKS